MKIPFINLAPQHEALMEKFHQAFDQVFEENSFILGPAVTLFEKAVEKEYGVPHAIGVNSGTDALLLSLKALGISAGDEVIVPTFTFVAVADVVTRLGARPVFVDVDPITYNVAIDSVTHAITPKTKAIIAVHMFGQACDLAQLMQLANAHGIFLVEDVSQAQGARIGNKYLGTMGVTGCFSFYPTKNLGGVGDGGMIITHNDEVAERIRRYRDHGRDNTGQFQDIGFNSRLDSLQAAVLKIKFEELDEAISDRIENARYYNDLLTDSGVTLPEFHERGEHTYNLYSIQYEHRDSLRAFLAQREIGTAVYYDRPLHLQPCFAYLGYKEGDFPVAERVSKRVISLPIYPGLRMKQLEEVAASILEFIELKSAEPEA
ncbi:TPA: transcriptional regulator [Candidatus Sumerlaeota bacterium]|jgi:dTDP-4-amino-4,6-dideoxygalactose transaminase|nr:transcriptional regulator [Candidatus Sumerlaeota bacterium]